MQFIKANDPSQGVVSLASTIAEALNNGHKALFLICGGSNIPHIVKALEIIHGIVKDDLLPNLTVALTDERYGPVRHKDSNWQQIEDMGANLRKIETVPVLMGKSFEVTVNEYSARIKNIIEDVETDGGLVCGIFGIGSDSHIAGILPGSPAIDDPRYVCGYDAGSYIRITITPRVIRRIGKAYAFAFGDSKMEAMRRLKAANAPIDREPCQILKELADALVYSDQF